jgi:hypothetical protein
MRIRNALTAVVAGGVIVLGILVAVPALAAQGGGPGNGPGPGMPMAAMGTTAGAFWAAP